MSLHVFLGPSLPHGRARNIVPNAVLHPPVQAGDVYTAVRGGATIIAIVDGLFETVPSVWHKEILFALSEGVHVFGASSMGALRAAELDTFGMVGIGAIYEAFRSGIHEDDDEVAVVHGDATQDFAVLSEAMVNLRHGLSLAVAEGVIGASTHDRLVAHAKGQPYPNRGWTMFDDGELLDPSEHALLAAFLSETEPDLKRDDAIAMLSHVAAFCAHALEPFAPEFEFEPTVFWDQLIAAVRISPETRSAVPIEALRAHVGAIEDDAANLFEGALLLYLCVKEAQRSRIDVDEDQIASAIMHFRHAHGIVGADAFRTWLADQRLDEGEFHALMRVDALVRAVAKHHSPGLDAFLPAQLKRLARYGEVAQAIEAKRTVLKDFGSSHPSAEDIGTTTDDLLDWYETRYRRLAPDLERHLEARRFVERSRFVRELVAQYLALGSAPSRALDHAE